MSKPASDKPGRRKAALTPYAIAWSMLGAVGLGYLGVAIFAPDMLGVLTPTVNRADRQRGETEAAVMKVSTDVNGLKASLTKLQLDVASVKADMAAQASQSQSLGMQLSALEDKVRLSQPPLAAAAGAAAHAAAEGAALNSMSPEPATPPSSAAPKPAKVINSPPPQLPPIVTGSVNSTSDVSKSSGGGTDAISFGAPIVKAAPKPIGIQIATDSTIDGLRLSWSAISQNYGDKLKNLTARYSDTGDATHPSFSLVAGPVKSKAEAKRLCKDLQVQAVSCKVGEFKGEAL
jgi:hypothetical protein